MQHVVGAPSGDSVRFHSAAKVVERRTAIVIVVRDLRGARGKVALPAAGSTVIEVAAVGGLRKHVAALRGGILHGLRDHAALKHPLRRVVEILHDDVCARVAKRFDVRRERRLPPKSRREQQVGSRGQVVDDLEHRRALVAAAGLVGQNVHLLGQVVRRLAVSETVHAVGNHANDDARTVHPVRAARRRCGVGDIALAGVGFARRIGVPPGVGKGLVGFANGLHGVGFSQAFQRGYGQACPHGAVARMAVDDAAAELSNAREQCGCDIGPNVHFHLTIVARRCAVQEA